MRLTQAHHGMMDVSKRTFSLREEGEGFASSTLLLSISASMTASQSVLPSAPANWLRSQVPATHLESEKVSERSLPRFFALVALAGSFPRAFSPERVPPCCSGEAFLSFLATVVVVPLPPSALGATTRLVERPRTALWLVL